MTPVQKLKWTILARIALYAQLEPPAYPCVNADQLYEEAVARRDHWDAQEEVRCSGIATNLPCEFDRHFETKAVALEMPDKSWVGWTYFYGGGKHSTPGAIDWLTDAYEVGCTEVEQVVIVKNFVKCEV